VQSRVQNFRWENYAGGRLEMAACESRFQNLSTTKFAEVSTEVADPATESADSQKRLEFTW